MSHSLIDKLRVAYNLPLCVEIAGSVLYAQDPHESIVQQEYVLFKMFSFLTVHLRIILVTDQLNAQILVL